MSKNLKFAMSCLIPSYYRLFGHETLHQGLNSYLNCYFYQTCWHKQNRRYSRSCWCFANSWNCCDLLGWDTVKSIDLTYAQDHLLTCYSQLWEQDSSVNVLFVYCWECLAQKHKKNFVIELIKLVRDFDDLEDLPVFCLLIWVLSRCYGLEHHV